MLPVPAVAFFVFLACNADLSYLQSQQATANPTQHNTQRLQQHQNKFSPSQYCCC
jgi:outer membrane biogenesis lipoprotein LolB